MNNNEVKISNYYVPFNYARNKLKSLNPHDISNSSGIFFDEFNNHFIIHICGDIYFVTYPNGNIFTMDGDISSKLDMNIIIIRYLINAKGIPNTNKFITFKEVPGGNVYYNNFLNRTIKRLSTEFVNSIDNYIKVMENLGAQKVSMGDLSYKFSFLGNTSMIFILWFGDDEFKPNANILFDSSIIYYFNTEDLAVIPDIAMDIIAKNINSLPK